MKKLFFITLLLITNNAFSQVFYENIEPMSIVKPEMENEEIDPFVFADLDKFKNGNDAVVYFIRAKSTIGATSNWDVWLNKEKIAIIKNKEYIVFHIDASSDGHSFRLPHMKFNYINFKSNRYYFIRTKGFGISTGYFNKYALKELKKTKLRKPIYRKKNNL